MTVVLDQAFENVERIKKWFSTFDSAIVAFSAGVDSSVLASCAYKTLGKNAIAVTSISPAFASEEIAHSQKIAREIGIELVVVRQDDLSSEGYVTNLVNRCYFCRSNLAEAIAPVALARKIEVRVEGTHADDMTSPRPGIKALREAGFRAPFVELGFHKQDIRSMAKLLSLSNAEKPSEACLSSRIAYGQKIDELTLKRIEDSETFIRNLIGPSILRVRTIGSRAIVELDKDSIQKAIRRKDEIEQRLLEIGYSSVEIDSEGYKSGKMLEIFVNESL
ncbi:MAG: ATP-dependent sacrificial sulfur transferase LarE [Nitrososphaerales archaeon]